MKKLTRTLWLTALILCFGLQQAAAQMQLPPLPVDPNVRIGKLENGLTYYIRHNEKPENRVEFYIAQKVGSILEEPQQRGLAHFLEHMAFNTRPGHRAVVRIEGHQVRHQPQRLHFRGRDSI